MISGAGSGSGSRVELHRLLSFFVRGTCTCRYQRFRGSGRELRKEEAETVARLNLHQVYAWEVVVRKVCQAWTLAVDGEVVEARAHEVAEPTHDGIPFGTQRGNKGEGAPRHRKKDVPFPFPFPL